MKTNSDAGDTNIFTQKVGEKAMLKLKASREKKRSVWFGLGMFGMVGWSVAVPTLAGTAFGIWLDKRYPETFSWTLTFLIAGLATGGLIAWHWISKENKDINQTKE